MRHCGLALLLQRTVIEVVDEVLERDRGVFVVPELDAVALGLVLKHVAPELLELRHGRGLGAPHVEVDDWPLLRPVPRRLDGQPFEEIALSLEEALEGGDGERLAEPARARNEELRAARQVGKLLQDGRLVDVREASAAELLEGIGICRRFFHGAEYNISCAFRQRGVRGRTVDFQRRSRRGGRRTPCRSRRSRGDRDDRRRRGR